MITVFSNKVYINGCEGRALTDKSGFWKYDHLSQLNQELGSIQKVHPGFYKIDFDEYYLIHCNTVSRWIQKLENDGKSIEVLSASYIPALTDRMTEIPNAIVNNSDIKKAIRLRKLIPGWNACHTEPLIAISPNRNQVYKILDQIKTHGAITMNSVRQWHLHRRN